MKEELFKWLNGCTLYLLIMCLVKYAYLLVLEYQKQMISSRSQQLNSFKNKVFSSNQFVLWNPVFILKFHIRMRLQDHVFEKVLLFHSVLHQFFFKPGRNKIASCLLITCLLEAFVNMACACQKLTVVNYFCRKLHLKMYKINGKHLPWS